MKNFKFQISNFKICICLLAVFFAISHQAYASQFYFEAPFQVKPNQEFLVDVFLDTQGKSVNVVSGALAYNADYLEVKKIFHTDGIINLWLKSPRAESAGSINFEAVIPGGFAGVLSPQYQGARPGKLFTVQFLAKSAPIFAELWFRDIKILLNDGQGSSDEATFLKTVVRIDPGANYQPLTLKDNEPPEIFDPQIIQDRNIYEGKFFLIFAAQDKGSGVSHYQIAESRQKENIDLESLKWRDAQSPYLLQDQKLQSYIYVKAVDSLGNERVVTAAPKNPLAAKRTNKGIWVIMALGLILLLFWKYKLKRENSNKVITTKNTN